MKRLIIISVMTAVFRMAFAQDSTLSIEENLIDFKKIEAEVAILHSLGNLKNYMNTTPSFGIWKRNKWSDKSFFNYGLQLYFPKKHTFQYANDDYSSETKSFAGNISLKLDKILIGNFNSTTSLSWTTGFGYGFYFFDDVKLRAEYAAWPESKKKKEEEPMFNRPFSTINLIQGLKLNIKSVSIFAQYNYTPYYIFTSVIGKNFGDQSLSIGLAYRQ